MVAIADMRVKFAVNRAGFIAATMMVNALIIYMMYHAVPHFMAFMVP